MSAKDASRRQACLIFIGFMLFGTCCCSFQPLYYKQKERFPYLNLITGETGEGTKGDARIQNERVLFQGHKNRTDSLHAYDEDVGTILRVLRSDQTDHSVPSKKFVCP